MRLARAVQAAGGLYVLSSAGSRAIDELARLCPGPRWFQIYVSADRGVCEVADRARARRRLHGARADRRRAAGRPARARPAQRLLACRRGSPPGRSSRDYAARAGASDFLRHPRVLSQTALNAGMDADSPTSLAAMINSQFDPSLSWTDIAWVQEQWDGPIVLKGVLHADDAAQAARLGLAGVIVSNHGGRQLDERTVGDQRAAGDRRRGRLRARGLHGRRDPPGRGHRQGGGARRPGLSEPAARWSTGWPPAARRARAGR